MEAEQKNILIRIISSIVLLIAACLLPFEGYLQLLVFLVPYAVVAYDVLWRALKNILHGEVFDENFLMSLATVGAFFIGEYPEAVAVMLFYQVGELFQDMAVDKSRKSIAALMDIRPDSARVYRSGVESIVSPEDIKVGETIVILPGEKIPLDGIITDGSTTVNTAALTGEALPQDKFCGDRVVSGTVNLSGLIKVEVQSEFGESTVSKILELTENASSKKARAENFITRFAKVYTPLVVISAVLLAILPPLFFSQVWSTWINRALIFLVVSCPCALVLSVPLSFFGGIGGASKQGILIKGASYLEALSTVKTVVFDKTGTLTQGSFTVTAIHPETISEEELLEIAAVAESYCTHPIAESIVIAHGKDIDKARVSEAAEQVGLGVNAVIDGKTIHVGNSRLMDAIGAAWKSCEHPGTVVHVAVNGEYMGHIVISDQIKPNSQQAIKRLKELGITQTVMLTGDMKKTAEAVAKELSIDKMYAELLPADKVSIVEGLRDKKPVDSTLAFVGDGINDAPVLSLADVGIAMGGLGSDAAIEAADVVLMDDNPAKIARAVEISRRTMGIVRQNIIFALSVKAIVLILGAFGIANMWLAVFADVGVSLLAVLNAMRALKS